MKPALSELSPTEFLALSRIGFLPRGLVAGCCVFGAGTQYDWQVQTGEITALSTAIRKARSLAVKRMRAQAASLDADGVVGVRLEVEHDVWRGARLVARCVAVGTAIAFDRHHAPPELRDASSLRLANHAPFNSDLKGHDLVTLLAAGFRPVTVAMGNCVYGLDPRQLRAYRGQDAEIVEFTQAFFDAREAAMDRLQKDLFSEGQRPGHPDAPTGIVGMTVTEGTYGGQGSSGPPIVEFSAIGTAIAPLAPDDPRRGQGAPKPRMVVPLDR
ncbi:MAG TPA: heavy metal-binding domain-containing protein [Polyangiaceae bacterium]|jgi:uncharacterized protein YbjQ (UPF0145 family)|nr:heavy metal-binding domain-containing protein [Polyangiaceae bacterium]